MTRRDHVQTDLGDDPFVPPIRRIRPTDRPTHGAGWAAALVAFGAMLMWVAVVFAVLLWGL